LVERLRNVGYDVVTSVEIVGLGARDEDVAAAAVAQRRVVVTRDCDDFRSLYGKLGDHPGLLLIYGFEEKATATDMLVSAVNNVANTYPALDNLILTLNDFVW
jgi:predicted nuclease of predicted toxin-antitoxin system